MTKNKKPMKRTTPLERKQIRECYNIVGMTLRQIGKAFDLTTPAILYIIKNTKADN